MPRWRWKYYTRAELMCPCGCERMELADDWIDVMEMVRGTLGFGLPVTSGYRCPAYNATLGGRRWHLKNAGDFGVCLARAAKLIRLALIWRVGGIGIRQHGPMKDRFVHLDGGPFRIWTYPTQKKVDAAKCSGRTPGP